MSIQSKRKWSPNEFSADLATRNFGHGPVVIGIDGADDVHGPALRVAVGLSRALTRPLLLVHVRRRIMPAIVDYMPIPEHLGAAEAAEDAVEARIYIALASMELLEGARWELRCPTGQPAKAIVKVASECDAALVVVGKRPNSFIELLRRTAAGSVARAVVAAQEFPVLIVP